MRELREHVVLSQTEVAEKVGVAAATVSRWEAGTRMPRPAHIRKLAGIFGVEPFIVRQAVEENYKGDVVQEVA